MKSHKSWKYSFEVVDFLWNRTGDSLEVFKKTLPTKLYWKLFPIEDLRQAVEIAKGILTKEKLDKQLTGQTSTSPFLNIRDGNERK